MTLRRIRPRILIVEGKDEVRVLAELLELAGIPWPKGNEPVDIEEKDGISNILERGFIETTLKASGVNAVGILVDANGDPTLRWEQVRNRVAESYPGFPEDLSPAGAIHVVADKPRIGDWIMPDNVRAGMLETLLLALRTGDPMLHDHARDVTQQAHELGAPFRDTHREKAELHTWLAWQDPPGRQLHDAVRAKALPPAPPVTDAFVAWFRQLFAI
ncbi:MAG: hypothetical protein E6J90_42235 [Deltaproteobacteria bacterium]|nr:MAG: hypothetical protein E6J91_37920 [Deltaproteobacteria bacterium]TMQ07866.1 MAG: hypothetical protein E6J90_42235 [Deltaproteobacteria bacterium]